MAGDRRRVKLRERATAVSKYSWAWNIWFRVMTEGLKACSATRSRKRGGRWVLEFPGKMGGEEGQNGHDLNAKT